MATLYLVRHGQTEYNANHIIQGHCDSPLTELGVSQAQATAEKLKDIDFTACYHSPLPRTVRTTEIILNQRQLPRIPDAELKEIYLGTLEGLCFTDERYAADFEKFWKYPEDYTAESNQGETYDELEARIYNCCNKIAAQHSDTDEILIVSHGAAIRSILNRLTNRPRAQFWAPPEVKPASISIIKWDAGKQPDVLSFAGNKVN